MKSFFALLALTAGTMMAQNPTITEILNNYGLINNGTVAQGAIFIAKGSNMADTQTDTLQSPPRLNLSGVEIRVTVNGVTTTCLMYYALNFQLAAILPSNTPVGTGTLIVINNGKTSAPRTINVVKSAFGMLTVNGAGTGLAAVHDPAYVLLSNTNAARPGMNVVFYGSGLGPVSDDLVPPVGSLTEVSITVTIGGVSATVLYYGRTIYPGLDQINVTIPTLQTYSCTVAVLIVTNGVQANAGTIPVTQNGTTCQDNPGGGGGNGGGGSNSGISITQSEIDTWIARGNYASGSISTSRNTAHGINEVGALTTTRTDGLFAGFRRVGGADLSRLLRGEIPPEFLPYTSQVGACSVYTGIPPVQYPALTNTDLDAGASVTASGPNGAQVAPRSIQGASISYAAQNVPNTYFAAGDYTFTGTGGPGAGAFTGNLNIGTDFVVTNPPGDFTTITRSQGIIIRWTGGDSSTTVQIFGSSIPLGGDNQPGTPAFFICMANNSAGQFTVPASVLNQLPVSGKIEIPGFPQFNVLFRGSLSVANANRGNRLTIPNIDYATAIHSWSWSYTPEYR